LIWSREFIAGLGGAAAWPVVARAQQADQVRRIGVLVGGTENDAMWQTPVAAFREVLVELGWIEGRNLRIDLRSGSSEDDRMRRN
jgi:putative tryptophan/tyrosine transport system substrate-binding protein